MWYGTSPYLQYPDNLLGGRLRLGRRRIGLLSLLDQAVQLFDAPIERLGLLAQRVDVRIRLGFFAALGEIGQSLADEIRKLLAAQNLPLQRQRRQAGKATLRPLQLLAERPP